MATMIGEHLVTQSSYSNDNTYVSLSLASLRHYGYQLSFSIKLSIDISYDDSLGYEPRTAFVYLYDKYNNKTLAASLEIKSSNEVWVSGGHYECIVSCNDIDVGLDADSISGYVRIQYSETSASNGGTCYWDGWVQMWSGDIDMGTMQKVPADAYFTIYYDATYKEEIVLNFEASGAENCPQQMTGIVYDKDESYTFTIPESIPSKKGYTFVSWNGYYPGDKITIKEDTTLSAVWDEILTYPFNLNILMPDGSETYNVGTVDVSMDNGSTWYEDQKNEPQEGNSVYPEGTKIKFKDFKPLLPELYLSHVSGAVQNSDGTWSATQGTSLLQVEFHTKYRSFNLAINTELDGVKNPDKSCGTFGILVDGNIAGAGISRYSGTHPYGTPYDIYDISEADGRKYIGYNVSDGVSLYGTIPAKDIEVILKYESISYSINYNLEGGSNPEDAPLKYTIDDEVKLPRPTKQGYSFMGWQDKNGNTIRSIPMGSMGDRSFVAIWGHSAEMFAKDIDHYRRGQSKVKDNGKWKNGTRIYKKINGIWMVKK